MRRFIYLVDAPYLENLWLGWDYSKFTKDKPEDPSLALNNNGQITKDYETYNKILFGFNKTKMQDPTLNWR